ncbi:MAG: hypothetical protein IJ781_08520 [Atopobiaceae bacterium]|nr:hypothetical protein [Atopobiaceae bacterium]
MPPVPEALPSLRDDVAAVLTRMCEMIYKEENIFFLLSLVVRDEDGTYLDAAELVEDFTAVCERFLGER